MRTFERYIKEIRKQGKSYFTTDQALSDLKISKNALYLGIHKLKKKGDIVSAAKDLYVIVPPEHQPMGCIPAEELIPILMRHWNVDYYACLLTAALYHGASHQKPQVFQVMMSKRSKPLVCGQIKIEFIYKKAMIGFPIQKVVVRTGYLNISTPEGTIYDLLLYPHPSGGLNHIATILSELIEVIDPDKLIAFAETTSLKAWLQRLGYMLEIIEVIDDEKKEDLLNKITAYISNKKLYYVPLSPEIPSKGLYRNKKWRVIENTPIESDYDS